MDYSSENFFNLVAPQEYDCSVGSYRVNHSLMLIRATKSEFDPKKTVYLTFSGVLYFEGPFMWKGANFGIGNSEECERLLSRLGFSGDSLQVLLNNYYIFVVKLPDLEIKILASGADKSADIPPNFPWLIRSSID